MTFFHTLKLAFKLLARDARCGELKVLTAALVIAVTSVTAVGFFTDRINQALQRQINELLGADLVLVSDRPLPALLISRAPSHGLKTAQTWDFPSMVLAGDRTQLAEIKAVTPGYPLRGTLRAAPRLFAPDALATDIPAAGTVWLDQRLCSALGVDVGARVHVGAASFTVSRVLTQESTRTSDLFNIAPRLLMNAADLPTTQLIQPASRVKYRLLLAGEPQALAGYRHMAQPLLQSGMRLESAQDTRPELRVAMERAAQFLGLAALVSVLLAGVAIAIATRRFIARHLDHCALLRALGTTQGDILTIYFTQILALGVLAGLIGSLLGYAAQQILTLLLQSLLNTSMPPASLQPVAWGMTTGLVTLLAFAAPPLLHLRHVPPLRVLRRELGALPPLTLAAYGSGALALGGLLIIQAGDFKLGAYIALGTAGAVALLALMAYLLIALLTRWREKTHVRARFGIANLSHHTQGAIVQVVGLGLGVMALLLLTLVRNDLLDAWQKNLPPQTPNRFLINVQPDQLPALRAFFAEHQHAAELLPMVRARLTAINERDIVAEKYTDDRARRLAAREFNLSWATTLQADNKIMAGQWWPDPAPPQFSVEEGLAATLGIKLGDTLHFNAAGASFSAPVTSLRKVAWDSFRTNFFVIAPPGVLEAYPTSYISAFYLPQERAAAFLPQLIKRFPNITVIDVAALMEQVRTLIERVSLAVEYVFLFALAAGILVLYAAIQLTLAERLREHAVLRTLGARRGQLLRGLWLEFTTLGLLAGIIAAGVAALLGFILATQIFHLPYTVHPLPWLSAILAATIGIALAGVLGTRSVLQRAPWETLRGA